MGRTLSENTTSSQLVTWRDIWLVLSDRKHKARERALRETGITLAFSLLPLFLGSLFAYTADRRGGAPWESLWHYAGLISLGGQLLLVSVSVAGSNIARLSDPESGRVQFSGIAITLTIVLAAVTAGLMGQDGNVSSFGFFPVNALSVAFFLFSMAVYLCLAIPSYLKDINPAETSSGRGSAMATALETRMHADG